MQEINEISIHAPARGATVESTYQLITQYISIHAPARGATTPRHPPSQDHGISIHAPARGATPNVPTRDPAILFQSTLPRGERRTGLTIILRYDAISIHAPARGATKNNQWIWSRFLYFNPRSREGSDEIERTKKRNDVNFNPRSREGSD